MTDARLACMDSVRTFARPEPLLPPLFGERDAARLGLLAGPGVKVMERRGVLFWLLVLLWCECAGEAAGGSAAGLGPLLEGLACDVHDGGVLTVVAATAAAAGVLSSCWCCTMSCVGVLLRCCRGDTNGLLPALAADCTLLSVLADSAAAMNDSTCSGTLPPIMQCIRVEVSGSACAIRSAPSLEATSRRRVTNGQLLDSS